MNINKLKLLKGVLYIGAAYFLIGAFAHFDGLTIFPFYDGGIYAPYHDSLIALAAVVFALILSFIARDPSKNKDALKAVIVGAILGTIFSFAIIWKVNFVALGAPGKETQTVVEGVLGVVFVVLLFWLYPREEK